MTTGTLFSEKRSGKMHVAKLQTSRRLQKLLAVMLDGIPRSPFELNRDSGVVYNPAITELSHNGIVIESERMGGDSRAHRYRIAPENIPAAREALWEVRTERGGAK